jgi:hypothetical protein
VIRAVAEEFEKAEVAEDLELLANFVADVGVAGMKFGQSIGVSVDISESEFEFAQGLHYLKYVECPASLFYPQFFQRSQSVVGTAYLVRSVGTPLAYDRDTSVDRNLFQQNVAANPAGAACGWGERLAAFNGG